jgi:predicted AlkP superfamily pyrophosphatase or phosphodiesterase
MVADFKSNVNSLSYTSFKTVFFSCCSHRTKRNRRVGSSKNMFVYSTIIILSFSFLIALIPAVNSKYINFKNIANNLKSNNIKQQRVLLVCLGGFRHDYIASYDLRNLRQFVQDGVQAAYLDPQFTTQSFPNMWSMATGAYVESHGIIANKFYDPEYDEYFTQNKHELKWWNETNMEPIWYTAARQGVKTGVYFWPGSETVFYNLSSHSTFYKNKTPYNENVPFHTKANQSMNWFLNGDYKFVCFYHNQPDAIAHKYGINSPEFNVTLAQLDEAFGALIAQLKETGLYYANDFNLIVVSDHGRVFFFDEDVFIKICVA